MNMIIEDPSILIDTLGPVPFEGGAFVSFEQNEQNAIANNLTIQMNLRRGNPNRDHFRSQRYGDYLFLRPHWTSRWWPKPPPAVQRRLPTHAGYRLAAPPP